MERESRVACSLDAILPKGGWGGGGGTFHRANEGFPSHFNTPTCNFTRAHCCFQVLIHNESGRGVVAAGNNSAYRITASVSAAIRKLTVGRTVADVQADHSYLYICKSLMRSGIKCLAPGHHSGRCRWGEKSTSHAVSSCWFFCRPDVVLNDSCSHIILIRTRIYQTNKRT